MKTLFNTMRQLYKKIIPKSLRHLLWKPKTYLLNIVTGKTRSRKALRFDVHLTEHCNLNCASCNHFSPLAVEKYLDVNLYRNDCARLADLAKGHIETVHLMGGEPLLHPRLNEIIKISRQSFGGQTSIKIVTNGILLVKQSGDFWKTCKENNIGISISKYPVMLNFRLINDLAAQYGVQIIHLDNIDKSDNWRSEPMDLSGLQNIKTNFIMCYKGNHCIQLKDGKLFTCQQAAYINHFNSFFNTRLEITEKDYISIYDDIAITDILRFLSKPIPFCRYCLIGDNYDRQWQISKKDISEWT
jgi:MoaA/NifB/PqqE/SkfB family radical SAM enzyme